MHWGGPKAWLITAVALVVFTARAGMGGRIDTVVHTPSKTVLVPAGEFFMGFAAEVLRFEEESGERKALLETIEAETMRACRSDLGDELANFCTDRFLWSASLPRRSIYLDAFEIDRYEVTTADYRECVAAGHCNVAPLVAGDHRYIRDEWPLVNATWDEAVRYCEFRGMRLPTEAEWEKAARGSDGRQWPWAAPVKLRAGAANLGKLDSLAMRALGAAQIGRAMPLDTAVGDDSDGYAVLAPPGTLPWGNSPYGASNMVGNVAEWTADYYAEAGYVDLPSINPYRSVPVDSIEAWRAVRGGSWLSIPSLARLYRRRPLRPDRRHRDVGFRCARSLR